MRTIWWGVVVVIVVAIPGCRVGGTWDAETLRSPHGGNIEFETETGQFTGELLLIHEDGIVFLQSGEAALVPWEGIRRLSFTEHPVSGIEGGTIPSARLREEMALASRYPYGLTDGQFQQLLDALSQAELTEIP